MDKRQLDVYNKIRNEVRLRGKKVEFFSYSKISTYIQCKLQYKFKYVDKLKTEFKNNIYTDIGTLTHELVEYYLSSPDVDKSIFKAEFIKQAEHFFNLHGLDTTHNLYKSLIDFAENSTFLHDKKTTDKNVSFEVPIYMRLKDTKDTEYWFVGFIDMVEDNEDGSVNIYDFKISNRSGYTGKKLEKACLQLYVYAYLYSLMYKKPIKTIKYAFLKYCDISFIDSQGKKRTSSNVERCKALEEFLSKDGESNLVIRDNFLELDSSQETILKNMKEYISLFVATITDTEFSPKDKDDGYCLKFCEYRKSGECLVCDKEEVEQPFMFMLEVLKKKY